MEESCLSGLTPMERPPPYYTCTAPVSPARPADVWIPLVELGASPPPANVEPSESESIEAILGDNGKLKLRAMGKLDSDSTPLIVQIRDKQDQTLMSSTLTTSVRKSDETRKSEKLTTFTDTSGKYLFTSKEHKGNLVVNSDRLVGVISRQVLDSSSKFRAQNAVGEEVFSAIRDSDNSFRFLANDNVVATAKNTKLNSANNFSIKFSPSLDLNTKILLIVAANYLNIRYFVDCVGGSRGTVGIKRQENWACCICSVVFIIIGCLILFGIYKLTI